MFTARQLLQYSPERHVLPLRERVRGERGVLGQIGRLQQEVLEVAVHQHAADLVASHQLARRLRGGGGGRWVVEGKLGFV